MNINRQRDIMRVKKKFFKELKNLLFKKRHLKYKMDKIEIKDTVSKVQNFQL